MTPVPCNASANGNSIPAPGAQIPIKLPGSNLTNRRKGECCCKDTYWPTNPGSNLDFLLICWIFLFCSNSNLLLRKDSINKREKLKQGSLWQALTLLGTFPLRMRKNFSLKSQICTAQSETPIILSWAVLPVYFSLGWLRETCIRQGLFPLWMVGAGTSPCLCLCCLWKGSGGPVWPAEPWIGPRDCGAVRKPWPCAGLNLPWGPTNSQSQASFCQTT